MNEFNLESFSKSAYHLEDILDYKFEDDMHLLRAVMRPAYAKEHIYPDFFHQEAYCTLGDGVLKVIIMDKSIQLRETKKGGMDRFKQILENKKTQIKLAKKIDLKKYVQWGKGEEKQAIWDGPKVLSDCFEALIGAIYLDGGMQTASEIFWKLLEK